MGDEGLPYGGTVRELRLYIARLAGTGDAAFERTLLAARPWSDADREINLLAHGCSLGGWATASLLGWIGERFGFDAQIEAAAMVQDMAYNGGAEWCDDLLLTEESSRG